MGRDRLEVGQRRLQAQRLGAEAFTEPAEGVRWMGALQAQDYGQSLWAIGARLQKPSQSAVLAAIEAGVIVRTWPMRGTIHWVPAEDAGWMVALSADRTIAASRTRRAQLLLDDETLGRAGEVLVSELTGGRRLNRPALMKLWTKAGISVEGQRGYHLLWHHAHAGTIAIGPMDGKQQTFVLLAEWVAAPRRLTRDESLIELAGRYLQSHGPASEYDFAWWAGLLLADARRGIAGCGAESVEMNGRTLFVSGGVGSRRRGARVQLLAGFDEFVIGYRQRSDVLAPEFAERVVPGNNGVFQPCVIADGRVVGTWKRLVRKGSVDIAVALFEPGTLSAGDVMPAAERFAGFLRVGLGELAVG